MKLERWLWENSYTQQELADMIGCSLSYAQKIVSGNLPKALKFYRKIEVLTEDENGQSEVLLKDLVKLKDSEIPKKKEKKYKRKYDD